MYQLVQAYLYGIIFFIRLLILNDFQTKILDKIAL